MSARSLSRSLRTAVAAGALTLALSGAAIAMPARPDAGGASAPPSGNVTNGTDVAGPDRQNPIPAQTKPVPAAPPTWPENPQPLAPPQATASADGGFQWDDAGFGAGGALLIVLAGFAATTVVRRRSATDPPLAA